jgi:CBS domain-containing protein
MKTSLIRYRVADFLRESPPFDAIAQDDLLALAASGRVSFHESDEFVFRQGAVPKPCFWVIQQGTVEIVDESPDGTHLQDLLASGDLLGLDGLLQRAAYARSARTACDVILYSIDAAALQAMSHRYPAVAAYLASHASLQAHQAGLASAAPGAAPLTRSLSGASWLDAAGPPPDFLADRLQLAGLADPLVPLLRLASHRPATAIAVLDAAGAACGIVSDAELRARWIAGPVGADDTCGDVMSAGCVTAPPSLMAHRYLSQMLQQRVSHLVITQDGSPTAAVQGLLSDADLSLLLGCNPVLLQQELLQARTPAAWRLLLRQARALKSAAWTDAQAHDRVADVSSAWDRALAESIVQAALQQVPLEDAAVPDPAACCWLLFGSAGRGEDVDPARPEIGVIYADPVAGTEADVAAHFSRVDACIARLLDECGLVRPRLSTHEQAVPRCLSQSQWRTFFAGVIANPVENDVYAARRLFDFQVLRGDSGLADALESFIVQAMKDSPHFIPILANDTLDHLPPMTFFQGLVIESDGAQTDTLDLGLTALVPITDAARVHALAAGTLQARTTLQRLDLAARSMPDDEEVFREASAAFRIVSRQATLAALSQPSGSPLVAPAQLSKLDQRLLKTSFLSIQALLELTSRPSRWMRPH